MKRRAVHVPPTLHVFPPIPDATPSRHANSPRSIGLAKGCSAFANFKFFPIQSRENRIATPLARHGSDALSSGCRCPRRRPFAPATRLNPLRGFETDQPRRPCLPIPRHQHFQDASVLRRLFRLLAALQRPVPSSRSLLATCRDRLVWHRLRSPPARSGNILQLLGR